jgi:glycosyltransferase involved in cell wall biosynthesis
MFEIATTFALVGLISRGVWAWKIGAWRTPISSSPLQKSKYTIIVCLHNEAERVDRLVNALLDQTPSPPQILLIDDGSTDDTLSLLKNWEEKIEFISVIGLALGGKGKKTPLAVAIKKARFPLLLCTDADCIPGSRVWASTMVNELETKYDLKIGVSLPLHSRGLLGRLQIFESERIAQNYIGMAESGFPYMGVGRNIAFTKSCWAITGGFKNHMDLASGDDDLFVQDVSEAGLRVGTEVSKNGQCHSIWPNTWLGWMKQMRRHLTTGPRYKSLLISILSIPILADIMLYGGCLWLLFVSFQNTDVIHSGIWIAVCILIINTLVRSLIFRTFLLRIGRPGHEAFWLALEPLMGLIRQVLVLQVLIAKPKKWK